MHSSRAVAALFAISNIASGVAAIEHHAITGVYVDPRAGSVPVRQNINDLEVAAGEQWDLYIRALAAMQAAESDDLLSYFQIAGIHGKPFISWDDSGLQESTDWAGYCPHNEKLFVSWHRPFVLLFEQTLVAHAKRIAKEYPKRYRYAYLRAAETLRAPYWDWGFDSNVPNVTASETVVINMPVGERLIPMLVQNPLATYHFPQAALDNKWGTFDFENRSQTYRCDEWPKSYPGSADAAMADRPYKSWLYDIFTLSKNFAEFSSTGDGGLSLEQIHNGVHWDGGCGGQFLAAEFSAFDPLFWLHHCNVDRLWAYWQAMKPEHKIFGKPYQGGSRFSTPSGRRITPDSPLKPFRDANGEFHTTKSVANIKDLGYSYYGLEYWTKTEKQMSKAARQLINRLYGENQSAGAKVMSQGNGRRRYLANIMLNVSQIERPASVNVYISGKEAGSLVVMGQPNSGILHGSLPLDDALAAAGLRRADVDDTVNSIQSFITVTITKLHGDPISLRQVPSLKVDIEDVEIIAGRTRDELPIIGRTQRRPALITQNRDSRLNWGK